MTTTSHEENRERDSAPTMDEKPPKRNPTLKEVNETLSFDYMFDHQPFDELPPQYYPQKKYNHRPPIFDWGITITTEELEEFGNKYGLRSISPNVPLTVPEYGPLLSRTVERFNRRHGLDVRTWVGITRPIAKGSIVLLKVVTNYGTSLSSDAVVDLCEDVETSFGKRGKWYISNANEFFQNDYCISLPNKKKTKKTKKTTESTSPEVEKPSE
ncbi:hypothetical protein L218DRAFT_990673 [Marasmius fiardii PR-910]|nr:hypothetical protein L218DRAFT_990673 [Marasmius fiardii PR-910]